MNGIIGAAALHTVTNAVYKVIYAFTLSCSIPFAQKRSITVAEKKNLEIRLNYKQYEFNETLSFPFSVPKNYKAD